MTREWWVAVGVASRGARAVVLGALLLSACATVPPLGPARDMPLVAVEHFDIAGRISARRGSDGGAAHFTWRHRADSDAIDVATPMGQTLARITADAARVRLERPGVPAVTSPQWDGLMRDVLGVPVPVEGLASWVVGSPRAGAAYGLERDAEGRPQVLRQAGWEIVYAYADGAPPSRPSRLVLRYADVEPIEVRLVVDRWIEPAAP